MYVIYAMITKILMISLLLRKIWYIIQMRLVYLISLMYLFSKHAWIHTQKVEIEWVYYQRNWPVSHNYQVVQIKLKMKMLTARFAILNKLAKIIKVIQLHSIASIVSVWSAQKKISRIKLKELTLRRLPVLNINVAQELL